MLLPNNYKHYYRRLRRPVLMVAFSPVPPTRLARLTWSTWLTRTPTNSRTSRTVLSLHRLRTYNIHRSTNRLSSTAATSNATKVPSSTTPTIDTLPFSSLETAVHPNTLKSIVQKPFNHVTMSPVQSKVLPLLPGLAMPYQPKQPSDAPRDLLVKAKTGTGKTLAFLIPAIESRLRSISQHVEKSLSDAGLRSDRVLESKAKRSFAMNRVGALIISPTRELATQIANEALKLLTYHSAMQVHLLVGGESRRKQVMDWSRGRKDIVVATPGRLRDLLNEKEFAAAFAHTQLLVLDEADSLLDMGFREDIDAITEYLPPTPERQTFLFSATVSSAIREVAREVLDKNHAFINCVKDADAPVHTNVKQYYTVLPSATDQVPHLLRLLAHEQLANPGSSKTIMFFPTTKMTQLFSSVLREIKTSALPAGNNTRIYEIHSKKTMESRTRTSADFRADKSGAAVLASSDVSARGVDYPGVTRIIQVGIPSSRDLYVHRVGRTGRGGEGGREGRGDLVLLPWEMGFVTWQLGEVPLKPITAKEMEKQVKEMAIKVDEDPKGYFNQFSVKRDEYKPKDSRQLPVQKTGFGVQGRAWSGPAGPRLFPNIPGYASMLDQVDVKVEELKGEMDESAVEETFMSMLGYYTSRTTEMKTDKMTVLESLKEWAVDCGGMMNKPTVSRMMLQRLGIVTEQPSRRGPRSTSRGEQQRGFGLKKKISEDGWEGEKQRKVKEWEWREGKQSMYGADRGRSQADLAKEEVEMRQSMYGRRQSLVDFAADFAKREEKVKQSTYGADREQSQANLEKGEVKVKRSTYGADRERSQAELAKGEVKVKRSTYGADKERSQTDLEKGEVKAKPMKKNAREEHRWMKRGRVRKDRD